jgi:hypothetical protein
VVCPLSCWHPSILPEQLRVYSVVSNGITPADAPVVPGDGVSLAGADKGYTATVCTTRRSIAACGVTLCPCLSHTR